jgi:CubicO group peptidase (beta-lactamase class C family)
MKDTPQKFGLIRFTNLRSRINFKEEPMNNKTNQKSWSYYLGLACISLGLLMACNQTTNSQTISNSNKNEFIKQALSEIINDGKAPGMIAAIISSEGVIAISSAGLRKIGSDIEFTTNDIVHLGSCTKAMTSTMIATLVAEGKLEWESKLIDVIPELKESIHSDYSQITLWQLLTHRAGFPDLWTHNKRETKERRLQILKEKLSRSPSSKIGDFNYSNLGYVGAACMAEKVSGLSWEVLMKKRLFNPLGMNSAGFGAPGTAGETDQPWGHQKTESSWLPIQSDCSEALGPAGRVHCTIYDWAKFLKLYLTTENTIIEQEYLNKLITPEGFYAGGWGVGEHSWAEGIVLSHNGSNAIWFTTVMVAPKLNRAYVVSTNSRDFGITEDVCIGIISKLIRMDLQSNKD